MILLDAPQDKANLVAHSWREKEERIDFRMHTDHYGLCRNMFEIIQVAGNVLKPDDEAIAAIVDADDRLSKRAFETVVKVYQGKPKTLITHGSYVKMSKGRRTKISRPNPKRGNIRELPWRSSHLKTIKWKVIKQAKPQWFQHKGKWLNAASDLALMFGCIEIAGLSRVEFVQRCIYYWYNEWSAEKVAAQKYCENKLRAK